MVVYRICSVSTSTVVIEVNEANVIPPQPRHTVGSKSLFIAQGNADGMPQSNWKKLYQLHRHFSLAIFITRTFFALGLKADDFL